MSSRSLPGELATLSHRLVSLPRLSVQDAGLPTSRAAAHRRRVQPVLAMAHASGSPFVSALLRAEPHGRVAVLVGGVTAHHASDEAPFPFPAGSRGARLRPGQADAAIGRIPCWEQTELRVDGLPRDEAGSAAPGTDELVSLLADRTLGLVVVARPQSAGQVQPLLDRLSDEVDDLEPMREGRGSERLRLSRAEGQLAYFSQYGPQGLWELEVWVGGENPGDARALAALVGASSDLWDVPLDVRPATGAGDVDDPPWLPRVIAGVDSVAALAHPPSLEMPGIRVVDLPTFDLTPEVRGPLVLGSVLDHTRSPTVPLSIPLESVNRHVFITGATGSGKSQTVRSLLTSVSEARIPWLVIEPAKAEYAKMAGRLGANGKVVVIRPGAPGAPPASVNPLEPSSILVGGQRVYFPLQTHVDLVRSLFTASFQAEEPFPQILAAALARSYEELGWSLSLGRAIEGDPAILPRFPTLSDVQRQALAAVDAIGYGREVRDNVQGFVRVRIDSLRQGTPGLFFEGGHPLDIESLLEDNVVFEIEDLGDDRDKAFFIGNLLIRLFEVLRLRESAGAAGGPLRHVTVIEEAHRLLANVEEGSSIGQAVTMFANLLAEVRAYGEGIIVAEQIPAKIIPDVVKNSAVKVMHRLPSADDRDFVGATMNLTVEQSETVVSLPPGVAVAHVDGMDLPVMVQVDGSGGARESRAKEPPPPPMGVRSPSCPSSCGANPCTLEHLVVSASTPDADLLTLWAEIVTVAHLMAEPPHGIGPLVLNQLAGLDDERARCTLSLYADAAVDRRSSAIRRFYEPTRLKRQVVTIMRRQWQEGYVAEAQDPSWAVASYRWADVQRALKAEADGQDVGQPHPLTAAWAKRGLSLSGSTWNEQYQQVRAVIAPYQRLFGAAFLGLPAVLPDVTDRLGTGPDPTSRLESALALAGLPRRWPVFRLGAHLGGP